MKTLLLIICLLISLKLTAQTKSHFDCDDFSINLSSNTLNHIEFISKTNFLDQIKDSIPKNKKPAIIENKSLNAEFQKKFPNTITQHCIHSKSFEQGKISDMSFCSEKYNIFLISKEYHFYIFKVVAFEIDCYMVFNTNDKTIFTLDNYPVILNSGKLIFDIGYSYNGLRVINYLKFNENSVDYLELSIPLNYHIKSYHIIKTSNNFKLATELIRYNMKETAQNNYEYDKTDSCSKFLNILIYND